MFVFKNLLSIKPSKDTPLCIINLSTPNAHSLKPSNLSGGKGYTSPVSTSFATIQCIFVALGIV